MTLLGFDSGEASVVCEDGWAGIGKGASSRSCPAAVKVCPFMPGSEGVPVGECGEMVLVCADWWM
jgi:hypothetical protein